MIKYRYIWMIRNQCFVRIMKKTNSWKIGLVLKKEHLIKNKKRHINIDNSVRKWAL